MKQLTSFVALLTAAVAGGQTPPRLSSGLELKVPVGWEGTEMKEAAALKPPYYSPKEELYLVKLEPGVDTKDPKVFESIEARYFPAGVLAGASAVTPFKPLKGFGYSRSLDFAENGQPARVRLYVIAFSGGAAVVFAAGKRDLISNREAALREIADRVAVGKTRA